MRLFCFPYAGGNASTFTSWSRDFPAAIGVCPVHLPGRGRRLHEPAFTDLLETVRVLSAALLPFLDRPFALFGHSMGALIAYELARTFEREGGRVPAVVFVSGRGAPHIVDPDPPTYLLPPGAFEAELRRLNGTPVEVLDNLEAMSLVLPTLRADFQAVQTYRYAPGPPLSVPIEVFGGDDDEDVPIEHLEEWGRHTRAGRSVTVLPGDHFFITQSREALVERICARLTVLLQSATASRLTWAG
jgi:medium-chain acyl-[acyl-carrier-protein] hydrolase